MSNIDSISSQIANLSEADRKALLSKVSAASIHHETDRRIRRALTGLAPSENHNQIIDRLAADGIVRTYGPSELHASAEDTRKARLAKLNAAKADPSHRSNIEMLEGLLRRGGVTLDSVAGSDLAAIDKAFASSKLTLGDKISAKAILHRYGAI